MKEILLAYRKLIENANAQIEHMPIPQAGLVFANTQANAKNQKSYFLPTLKD